MYTRVRKAAQGDAISFVLKAQLGGTVNNYITIKNRNKPQYDRAGLKPTSTEEKKTVIATPESTLTDDGWDELFAELASYSPIASTSVASNTSDPRGASTALKGLQDLFVKYNVPVTITSDYREGAKTKQGRQSYHATGNAMDIIPKDGHDFAEIAKIIRETPEIKTYMQQHGYGVLDETTEAMLKRTGGTGAHYHIGPDRIAQKFWEV